MAVPVLRRIAGAPQASVRRWAGRRLLARSVGRGNTLADLSNLPAHLTMPLRRSGLDPLPALAEIREADPVTKLSRVLGMNVWLVTGYDEARAVLSNTQDYSTDIRSLLGGDGEQAIGGLGFTDPPEHTRLRRLLAPEFTGRRLADLLPKIERIVDTQLDVLAAGGPVVDLVSQFAFPVPFHVICELLGLPDVDREPFRLLGHARFDVTGGGPTTFTAMAESLMNAVSAQRQAPGDGLIGAVVREHGDEVTDLELSGLIDGVFTGGYETSASMIALGTLALIRDPAAFALVRDHDDAVDTVVNELLRYLSVVQISFPRFARRDLQLFGRRVKAGDVVVCSLSAANRDAAFGAGADRFDPHRPPRPHLAFGHGFHRCIGSELGRMELRVALRALTRRFPDIALAVDPGELRFRDLSIVYGVQALPVRLWPASDPGGVEPEAADLRSTP